MNDKTTLVPTLCAADDSAAQMFPIPSVPYISIESPIKVESIDLPFFEKPDFWVSLAAVAISIFSIYYSKKQATDSRDESINDIFWFREVVYPRSVVPLLELLDSFSSHIPAPSTPKTKRKTTSKSCIDTWNIQRSNLNYKLTYVALWNKDIFTKINDSFELIEDSITQYCFNLQSNSQSLSSEYNDCLTAISDLQKFLFTEIKQAHLGVQPISWLGKLKNILCY